jgi:hypothetical protein
VAFVLVSAAAAIVIFLFDAALVLILVAGRTKLIVARIKARGAAAVDGQVAISASAVIEVSTGAAIIEKPVPVVGVPAAVVPVTVATAWIPPARALPVATEIAEPSAVPFVIVLIVIAVFQVAAIAIVPGDELGIEVLLIPTSEAAHPPRMFAVAIMAPIPLIFDGLFVAPGVVSEPAVFFVAVVVSVLVVLCRRGSAAAVFVFVVLCRRGSAAAVFVFVVLRRRGMSVLTGVTAST